MGKQAVLPVKSTLNKSGFSAGLKAMKGEAAGFARGLGGTLKGALTSPFAAIGAGLAGVVSVVGIGAGLKGVFDYARSLKDLSAQTGESTDKLQVFQQVLKDNGVEADEAGGILNKMQKAVVGAAEGTEKNVLAFSRMKLEVKDLIGLSPVDQFREIGDAIKKIENPAVRARLALDTFGKTGGHVLGALGDSAGYDAASKRIGIQAQLLKKNAEVFSDISIRLSDSGLKLQGFFVGVADSLAPMIEKLTASLDGMDFAKQGQAFGLGIKEGVEFLTGAFANPGELLDVFGDYLTALFLRSANQEANSLIWVGKMFGGTLIAGFGEGIAYMGAGLEYAFSHSLSDFKMSFYSAVFDVVSALLKGLSGAVDLFKKGMIAGVGIYADVLANGQKSTLGGMAGMGKGPGGIDFANTLERWKKNTILETGKGLMSSKLGNTDFFGAGKWFDKANAAADKLREAGEKLIGAAKGISQEAEHAGASFAKIPFSSTSSLNTGHSGLVSGGRSAFDDFFSANADKTLGSSLNHAYAGTPLLPSSVRRAFENDALAQSGGERAADATGAYGRIRSGDAARRKSVLQEREIAKLKVDKGEAQRDEIIKQTKLTADLLAGWG